MTPLAAIAIVKAGELLSRVEHPASNMMQYMRLAFCTVCALQALIAGSVAYVFFQRKRAKLARCTRLEAEIVGFRESPSDEGTVLHPIVRYPGPKGKLVEFETKFGRGFWSQNVGDRVQNLRRPRQTR